MTFVEDFFERIINVKWKSPVPKIISFSLDFSAAVGLEYLLTPSPGADFSGSLPVAKGHMGPDTESASITVKYGNSTLTASNFFNFVSLFQPFTGGSMLYSSNDFDTSAVDTITLGIIVTVPQSVSGRPDQGTHESHVAYTISDPVTGDQIHRNSDDVGRFGTPSEPYYVEGSGPVYTLSSMVATVSATISLTVPSVNLTVSITDSGKPDPPPGSTPTP